MRYILILIIILIPSISFTQSVDFESTNLGLIILDTEGHEIVDEPKIQASMKIVYQWDGEMNAPNDTANIYDGNCGIEFRGAYSQTLPQKPYGFETLDAKGDEINVPLFGFPEENDWILLANYNDKSFVRNSMIFSIFRKMGHYAPRTMHCELIINDDYEGIYVLTEKIKRDRNRVNIPSIDFDDNAGDSLTGGYIFKVDYSNGGDYWTSEYTPEGFWDGSVRFIYTYPKPDDITDDQREYLQNHVDEFEDVLYGSGFKNIATGYRSFLDVRSFVDYFIIGELTRNVDAYKKSCHYYKQPDSRGGLIFAGPVWDFDWAMKNFAECIYRNTDGSGWAYQIHECNPSPVPPAWISRLLTDSYFENSIYTRYFELRNTILSENYIFNHIDSMASVLNDAQERHYTRWPILGENVGTFEVDYIPETFTGEIQKYKDWFSTRLAWLDANMMGELLSLPYPKETDAIHEALTFYPNPVEEAIHINSTHAIRQISIFRLDGSLIKAFNIEARMSFSIDLSELSAGFYILKGFTSEDEVYTRKILKN